MSSDHENGRQDLSDTEGQEKVRQGRRKLPEWVTTFVPPVVALAGSIIAALIISTGASKELREDIKEMGKGIATLSVSVGTLDTNMSILQADVAKIRVDVTNLQEDVVNIRERVSHIDGRLDGIDARIESIEGRIEGIENRTYPSTASYIAEDW